MKVLNNQAALYSYTGLLRKEAIILREILSTLLDMLDNSRRRSVAPQDAHVSVEASLGRREVESTAGNESVAKIIYRIANAYGVNLSYFTIVHSQPETETTTRTESTETPGWEELRIGMVREVIFIAENLPDYIVVAQLSLSALWACLDSLVLDDQIYLYSTALRSIATAQRRGDTRLISFWLKCPLLGIKVNPSVSYSRSPTLLSTAPLFKSDSKELDTVTAGPFIYDPKTVMRSKKPLLVKSEAAVITIDIYNPFSFPLELPNITLCTTGIQLQTSPINVTLPPRTTHSVALKGTPVEIGGLSIRGCQVRLPGSPVSELLLSSISSSRTEPNNVHVKHFNDNGSSGTSVVECEVAPSQPLLRVRKTSMMQGALMLYEGERLVVRLVLENISDISVKHLRVTFNDTLQEAAKQDISTEEEVSDIDVFDLHWHLRNRPVFTLIDQASLAQHLNPGELTEISLTCFGKAGCTYGSIQTIYGGATVNENPNFSRLLELPMLMTVWRALEVKSIRILPFSTSGISHLTASKLDIPKGANTRDWCLIVLLLQNLHATTFEVNLDVASDDTKEAASRSNIVIPSYATSSALLPVRRLFITDEEAHQPIPQPAERQFVLRRTHTSSTSLTDRELFWYREKLFSRLRASWKELGGGRSGELMIRNERLDDEMLPVLKSENVCMDLRLQAGPSTQAGKLPLQPQGTCKVNDFVYVRIHISSRTNNSIAQLSMSISVDPSGHAILEGSSEPERIQIGDDGMSENVQSLIFTAAGTFSLTAILRELSSGTVVCRSTLPITVTDVPPELSGEG